MFDANDVPASIRKTRIVDSSVSLGVLLRHYLSCMTLFVQEDCLLSIFRMLDVREFSVFAISHKDYTMAIALRRLGFQLCVVHDELDANACMAVMMIMSLL